MRSFALAALRHLGPGVVAGVLVGCASASVAPAEELVPGKELAPSEELAQAAPAAEPAQAAAEPEDRAADEELAALLHRGLKLLQSDDVEERYEVAKMLERAGQDELALQHYVWLWPNSRRKASYGAVRLSFMLADMRDLARRSEAAREAFDALFEEVEASVAVSDTPDFDAWHEFTSWCKWFGREEAVLAWYEAHRAEDGSLPPSHARDTVFNLLVERHEWHAAGRLGDLRAWATDKLLHADAMRLSLNLATVASLGADAMVEARDGLGEYARASLRKDLSNLCAVAWATGRDDQARSIARQLLGRLDDAETRRALVEAASAAVNESLELQAWLAEVAVPEAAGR
jgi:hypothetical protein